MMLTNEEFFEIIMNKFIKNDIKVIRRWKKEYSKNLVEMPRYSRYEYDYNSKGYLSRKYIDIISDDSNYINKIHELCEELQKEFNFVIEKSKDLTSIYIYTRTVECEQKEKREEEIKKEREINKAYEVQQYKKEDKIDESKFRFLIKNDIKIKDLVYEYFYLSSSNIKYTRELIVYPEFIDAFFSETCYKNTYDIYKKENIDYEGHKNLIHLTIYRKEDKDLVMNFEKEKAMKDFLKKVDKIKSIEDRMRKNRQEMRDLTEKYLKAKKELKIYEEK